MRNALHVARSEPRVPNPPLRVWRDWALVAALVPSAVIEFFLRDDIGWPVVSLISCLVVVPLLLVRRAHPLLGVVVMFSLYNLIGIAGFIAGVEESIGMYTTIFVLIFIYTLFRWGSGHEMAIGLVAMAIGTTIGVLTDYTTIGEAIGGVLVVIVPAELGVIVRNQHRERERSIEKVKSQEREQIARELHDVVAHHVSAIAVQAQAARAVAPTDPATALKSLEVIEEQASRTLIEMRLMVGALRQDESDTDVAGAPSNSRPAAADFAPQRGINDIGLLADSSIEAPRVDVQISGDVGEVRAAVDAAVYRLAQESITNARRHARLATRVWVRVIGDPDSIRLVVEDDGEPIGGGVPPVGYGLTGMAERVKLLGGTFFAGPLTGRGWRVDAHLPRSGATT